jgi:hypothetical protein
MSTAVLIVMPSTVPSAAAATPVLATAGAAVLVVGAAVLATELTVVAVRKAAEYGEQLDRAADAQARNAVDAGIWGTTVAHVVELNARLAMFEARAGRAGVRVEMPARLDVAGCEAVQAAAWCKSTAKLLEKAQLILHEDIAEHELTTAVLALPSHGSTAAQAEAAATLGKYQRMMRNRYAADVVNSEDVVISPFDVDVQEALRLLDPDASDDEHAQVLGDAAKVARFSARPDDAHRYLRNLISTVVRINGAVAERRLAAEQLTALEDRTVADLLPHGPFSGTAAMLRGVLSGDIELTDGLRSEAKKAVEWADGAARRNYLMEQSRACMSELGYDYAENADALELGKAEWGSDYSAETWMDEQGRLHGRVLREHEAVGDAAKALDAERCAEFVRDLNLIGERAGARVQTLSGDVQVRNGDERDKCDRTWRSTVKRPPLTLEAGE